jgi:hypothetical protein
MEIHKIDYRSAYENAPGGCVCLKKQMLEAMYAYAIDFYDMYGLPIEINAIAGSSHSVTSWHYEVNPSISKKFR